jgi:hypothetical protein
MWEVGASSSRRFLRAVGAGNRDAVKLRRAKWTFE